MLLVREPRPRRSALSSPFFPAKPRGRCPKEAKGADRRFTSCCCSGQLGWQCTQLRLLPRPRNPSLGPFHLGGMKSLICQCQWERQLGFILRGIFIAILYSEVQGIWAGEAPQVSRLLTSQICCPLEAGTPTPGQRGSNPHHFLPSPQFLSYTLNAFTLLLLLFFKCTRLFS